ncbi:MAG: histidine phosphatase family protein [Acutalibacteraceae bacterium]|nr:histidine phosphatase family protein [Acutalibacteraceae bacterium]
MKSYQIHFIRHASTIADNKGQYIGSTDVPLSQQGIDDLKKYDELYKYPGTPIVYTSPLLRCVQTCNVLYPHIKPTVVNGLAECSFGDWEGKTADMLQNDPAFTAWLANSRDNAPPNGESGIAFTKRICKAFEGIVENLMNTGETTAVVVTHGGVIMTLMSVYGLPQAESYRWQMDNCFGYSLRITPMLWMRDKVAEVYDYCPRDDKEE